MVKLTERERLEIFYSIGFQDWIRTHREDAELFNAAHTD